MLVPATFSGLRLATILLGIYGFVWIALEGDLRRVTLLGVGATAIAMLNVLERAIGGKSLTRLQWLSVTTLAGLLCGAGSAIATISFMALLTGFHAHGPEFTSAEVATVWAQLPLWSLVGLIAGLGFGLLAMALSERQEPPQA